MFSGLPRYNCKVIEHQTKFPKRIPSLGLGSSFLSTKVNSKHTLRDDDNAKNLSSEDDSRLSSEQQLEEVDNTGAVQLPQDVQLLPQDTYTTSFDNFKPVEGFSFFSQVPSDSSFPNPPEPRKKRNDEKFYYCVRVATGNMPNAYASTHGVKLELIGTKGSSNETCAKVKEYWFFHSHFKQGSYDDLWIESDGDLGKVLIVKVSLSPPGWIDHFTLNGVASLVKFEHVAVTPQWFIDFIIVHDFQDDTNTTFPCYHWIGHHQACECTSEIATLQDVADNEVLLYQRKRLVNDRKKLYQWHRFEDTGVPSAILIKENIPIVDQKNLPLDEQFQRVKMVNFLGDALKGAAASATAESRIAVLHELQKILNLKLHSDLRSLNDFEIIAVTLQSRNYEIQNPGKDRKEDIPTYTGDRWVSDVEFGRQILNGVNPVLIKKCTKIPDNFAVTSEMVQPFMNDAQTLDQAMQDGLIYICDLNEIMHGLPTRGGYYCAAPWCLLYVNGSKQLVPIAIQLNRGDDNPVFLPNDNWYDWLLAKMFYRSADAQYHQIMTHYISCHATMEAYGVATMRNLPDAHPVYKLLRPHFRYTMAINSAARATLINKDGIIAQNFAIGNEGMETLFKRCAGIHRVQCTNIKRNLKERGVEDSEKLPGYYYRDNGLKIWQAMEEYVQDIVNLFYDCDDDVKRDIEIQNWAQDIHENAFLAVHGAPQGHGFPSKIDTKEELVEYCTLIMFTGSAQHAAVNFGQFNIYGYAPNAPLGMRKKPPTMKSEGIDRTALMKYLPDVRTAAFSASITYTLAQISDDEIFIKDGYPFEWFSNEEAFQASKRYKQRLADLDNKIAMYIRKADMKYAHLMPSRVPNSITI